MLIRLERETFANELRTVQNYRGCSDPVKAMNTRHMIFQLHDMDPKEVSVLSSIAHFAKKYS